MVSSSSTASAENSTVNNNNFGLWTLRSTPNVLLASLAVAGCLHVLYRVCQEAYEIRMYAINEYGRVIHEFDPYFNYRATEYLYEHGWKAFATWFDYLVWYPLGRPVGTTIYPGMQVTAVFIKNHILPDMSINDICCFVPCWFGVSATLAVFGLTYACTSESHNYKCIFNTVPFVKDIYQLLILRGVNLVLWHLRKWTGTTLGMPVAVWPAPEKTSNQQTSWTDHGFGLVPLLSATAAAAIMSIVPAHLLRSVGGGYDNESVAMTAMVGTFACWCMALRDTQYTVYTIIWGLLTGLAYFNMVAAWGGYTFVLNLIGVHAGLLVVLGRYTTKLWIAYSCFFVLGTFCAMQVPVVGWAPLKSLEQMGPLAVFGGMQLIEGCQYVIRKREAQGKPMNMTERWQLRVSVFATAGALAAVVVALLMPTGYFGPLSSRIRGLFVKHTKTGNPLVDSVAEHQAAKPEAYKQYLHDVLLVAPTGFVVTALFYYNDASSFLLVYTAAAYYFSHRMVRLILLTSPIASVLGGIAIGRFLAWASSALFVKETTEATDEGATTEMTNGSSAKVDEEPSTKSKKGKKGQKKAPAGNKENDAAKAAIVANSTAQKQYSEPLWSRLLRMLVAGYAVMEAIPHMQNFYDTAHSMAKQLSHPTIIQKATTRDGETVVIDDYRQAYLWLKDHTPEDARIMAWWDYGYQITGIGNRTTIADGNTWNHEHIAFLGRTLTAPEKDAHRIARHLADYVLVWAGGGGDDLAKSPHLRRIANSVYRGLCSEPTCRDFGFYSNRVPTAEMAESLLYKLVAGGVQKGVEVDRNRFREVFRSKYAKVRIYKVQSVSQESKDWVADPKNRLCDAPGSWYCPGQYPPALHQVLAQKKDFKQLEDFNVQGEADEEYQREYMDNLLNRKSSSPSSGAKKPSSGESKPKTRELKFQRLEEAEIDLLNEDWKNTDETTLLWELVSQDRVTDFMKVVSEHPKIVHMRSEDGRGPMWWAHEHGRDKFIGLMKTLGVREDRQDASGKTPLDVKKQK